jgi:carboxyl-terminal processing protease
MADSTLATFYTTNGRKVLEGRGVIPDVEVPNPDVKYVLAGLQEQGVLFDFAVAQRDALAKPENAADFKLTDRLWDQFVTHVAQMDEVPYASESLQAFQKLEATAEAEWLDSANAQAFDALRAGLSADVSADLARHEAAIRRALEQELVVHLYNTNGQFKHGLQQDEVALKAVALLESGEYLDVLAGPNSK